jgi:hypothetical protein
MLIIIIITIINIIIKLQISVKILETWIHASTLLKLKLKAKQKFYNQRIPEICLYNCHKESLSRNLYKKICMKYMKKLQAIEFATWLLNLSWISEVMNNHINFSHNTNKMPYGILYSGTLHLILPSSSGCQILAIIYCDELAKSIARQHSCKHTPTTHEHATIGRLLLGNGVVNRLHQQYRLCFPLGPWKVVIREVNSKAGSHRSMKP